MEHMSERLETVYMLFDMKQALFEEAFKASENGDETTYKVLASIIDRAHTKTQYEEWSKRQKEINEHYGK